MLRTAPGFVLLLGAIALWLLVGSLWPPTRLAIAGVIAALAMGATGLRVLWRPVVRR
ncbi:MAG: hypothetical protein M3282_12790 [Gemmatimonadota bacterium]|nr:hypothetical protein [Gemmatimonadota bacterium]